MSVKKIGLIVGREWSFPPAFIEEVNQRDAGVIAEYVKMGGTRMDEPCEYAVLIDRILPLVPGLVDALRYGISVLDVGCGSGRALNRMAREFPHSRFTGYDLLEEAIEAGRTIVIDKPQTVALADQLGICIVGR